MTIEEEVSIAEKAEAGDVDAQLLYGKMLCGFADRVVESWNGGVEVARYWDLSNDGMRWLSKAAKSGNKEAGELLRQIKNREIHVVTEPEHLFKKAMRYISGGGAGAHEAATEMLLDAADLASKYGNEGKAIEWLEKAVGLGSSDAAQRLGELLSSLASKAFAELKENTASAEGKGKELVDHAVSLTIKAAETGCSRSQTRLAAMYVDGMVGGETNKAFKLTGEIMRAKAQLFQELVINQGRPVMEAIEDSAVSTSEMEARYWLLKAEMSGNDVAHLCLEAISAGKTAKEAIDMYRDRII